MRIMFRHLNMNLADHIMVWAACCLAYFGFLRSAEFTVPDLKLLLSRATLKHSGRICGLHGVLFLHPCQYQWFHIFIGRANPSCARLRLFSHTWNPGRLPGSYLPIAIRTAFNPCSSKQVAKEHSVYCKRSVKTTRVTAYGFGQPRLRPAMACQTIQTLGLGPAMHLCRCLGFCFCSS